MEKEKWAVIDIGSNTIRLVIYEKSNGGSYKETENIKTVARLRRYLNQERVLQPEGVTLLIDILQGFKDVIHFHHISNIYCVATATIRQSKNQQEIVALVKEKTGFDMQIFSEKEEAFFGYYAVSRSTPIDTGVTIDMGGGSTEITYFQNRELIHYHSFPFGVVSLKEQFMKQDQITGMERNKLKEYILHSFDQASMVKKFTNTDYRYWWKCKKYCANRSKLKKVSHCRYPPVYYDIFRFTEYTNVSWTVFH